VGLKGEFRAEAPESSEVERLLSDLADGLAVLTHRKRAEQALASVVAEAYVKGVSTRRIDDVVEAMGIEGMSPSQVSRLSADLDVKVTEFRERPLDAGPYRYVWIDALTQKVREGGRVVNVSAVIATAVNNEGRREIIGFDIVTTESTASWTAFLRSLVARGLTGVELVISDAHGGIKAAIGQVLTGAGWQRCRTHFISLNTDIFDLRTFAGRFRRRSTLPCVSTTSKLCDCRLREGPDVLLMNVRPTSRTAPTTVPPWL
jgi:hypothetical protein